jgi:chromosome segregation ATPase
MSTVKTRNEIKGEMKALTVSIEQARAEHAAQVAEMQASIAGLTFELEQAKVALVEADKTIEARAVEVADLQFKLADAQAKQEEEANARAEMEGLLAKAKSALANPAFADASIVPHSLNQSQADAEADKAEADAEGQQQAEDVAPKSELDTYESMPPGPDRRAYLAKHKTAIHQQMSQRNS